MQNFLLLTLFFGSLAASGPIDVRGAAPAADSLLANIKRDNLDILVPDANGTLIRTSQTAARDLAFDKRQTPGEVSYIGDGSCDTSRVDPNSCNLFCGIMSSIIKGKPVAVSADIDCTTTTCSTAYAYAVTVEQSFSFNVGFTVNAGQTSALGASANLGGAWTWAQSLSTSNTYTFNPDRGDKGHIIFVPYLAEACGAMTTLDPDPTTEGGYGCVPGKVAQYDPMACGQTPIKLASDTHTAAGIFSFCNVNTGSGCG